MTLGTFDLHELEGEIADFEDTYDYDSWADEEADTEWDRIREEIKYNDLYDDGQALASAGWGTDEDYGYYSDEY